MENGILRTSSVYGKYIYCSDDDYQTLSKQGLDLMEYPIEELPTKGIGFYQGDCFFYYCFRDSGCVYKIPLKVRDCLWVDHCDTYLCLIVDDDSVMKIYDDLYTENTVIKLEPSSVASNKIYRAFYSGSYVMSLYTDGSIKFEEEQTGYHIPPGMGCDQVKNIISINSSGMILLDSKGDVYYYRSCHDPMILSLGFKIDEIHSCRGYDPDEGYDSDSGELEYNYDEEDVIMFVTGGVLYFSIFYYLPEESELEQVIGMDNGMLFPSGNSIVIITKPKLVNKNFTDKIHKLESGYKFGYYINDKMELCYLKFERSRDERHALTINHQGVVSEDVSDFRMTHDKTVCFITYEGAKLFSWNPENPDNKQLISNSARFNYSSKPIKSSMN